MNLQYISFQSARIGSALFHDYISQYPAIASFYAFSPRTEAVQTAILARKKNPVKREQLVSILHQQYQGIPLSERLKENILSLKNENTFTITTGHQLSLMGGPLYFFYKIISVIALSEQCKELYPEYHFVPVYWMNSEDHDFDEINHIWLNKNCYTWPRPIEKKIAVGKMPLKGLDAFFEALPDSVRLYSSFNAWKNTYLTSANLADATRKLVNLLFGEYGLVVIDQDNAQLKRLAFDVFHKELTLHESFRLVNETSTALENLGYHAQVKPREINLFYHHPDAGRQRLVLENDTIRVLNTNLEFQVSQLDNLSDELLGCFSTNVVTRPMYQQSVLPNIIYVGGPAEISYWLQFKSMFEHYGVFYPMLLMRDSWLVLNSSVARKINKLGISLQELFAEESVWQKTQISRLASEVNFKPVQQTIEQTYHQLAEALTRVDPTLKPAALAELQKQLHALKHLETKYIRAWKQKNENLVRQLHEIRETVYPGGELQERHNHIWAYTSEPEQFVRQIIPVANPWKQQVKIIEI